MSGFGAFGVVTLIKSVLPLRVSGPPLRPLEVRCRVALAQVRREGDGLHVRARLLPREAQRERLTRAAQCRTCLITHRGYALSETGRKERKLLDAMTRLLHATAQRLEQDAPLALPAQ